jgi:hypothetical protein
MAIAHPEEDMDADDLTKTDKAILDALKAGRESGDPWGIATKGRLVDETGKHRNSVYNRLDSLRHAGHVELIHESTREFKFVSDPREAGDGE